MTTEKFTHEFQNDLSCTVIYSIENYKVGATTFQWSHLFDHKLALEMAPEYRQWRDETSALIAAKYGIDQKHTGLRA